MAENFTMTVRTRADGSECCAISYKGQPVAALWTDAEEPLLDICTVDQRDAEGVRSWSNTLGFVKLKPANEE